MSWFSDARAEIVSAAGVVVDEYTQFMGGVFLGAVTARACGLHHSLALMIPGLGLLLSLAIQFL